MTSMVRAFARASDLGPGRGDAPTPRVPDGRRDPRFRPSAAPDTVNALYQKVFETGVDEMSWDDMDVMQVRARERARAGRSRPIFRTSLTWCPPLVC